MFRHPASLHRVAVEGRSPCFVGTTRTLRLPALHPAGLRFPSPWRYHGCVTIFAPSRRMTHRRGPGCCFEAATHTPPIVRGKGRISQVPAETLAAAHMLLRPRKNRTELALALHPTRPRLKGTTVASSTGLSRLNRMARRLAVYASHRRVTPPARKTRFRPRGYALPGGACTHWVSR